MKKQLLLIGTILLIVTVCLCGCNQKSDVDKFIGTWKGSILLQGNDLAINETYIFLSNNTINFFSSYGGSSNNTTGKWKIENNKLILNLNSQMITANYRFSNNDKILWISDINGEDINLTKQ